MGGKGVRYLSSGYAKNTLLFLAMLSNFGSFAMWKNNFPLYRVIKGRHKGMLSPVGNTPKSRLQDLDVSALDNACFFLLISLNVHFLTSIALKERGDPPC